MGNMIDGGEIIARMIKNEGVGHIFTLSRRARAEHL